MTFGLKPLLLFTILIAAVLTAQGQEQPAIDSNILRFIQQEELKSRAEIKAHITAEMDTNKEETQRLIDDNKRIIYKELDGIIRKVVFRIGIIWFVATLTALICYRFILIAIRRKFVKKGLRNEYTS